MCPRSSLRGHMNLAFKATAPIYIVANKNPPKETFMRVTSIHPIFRATYKNAHKQEQLEAFRALYQHKVSQ